MPQPQFLKFREGMSIWNGQHQVNEACLQLRQLVGGAPHDKNVARVQRT